MKLEQKQGFRVSDDGAYYINIESEDILERMRKKNISLSKKARNLGVCMKAAPIIAFFIAYPLGALVSSIIQKPVEDAFYIVAPVLAIALYFSLKKLSGAQQGIIEEMGKQVDSAVAETQEIAYGERNIKDDAEEQESDSDSGSDKENQKHTVRPD
ncbi:hypothetical protein ACXHQ0_19780 [Vibrio antiquarius]|uniref:Uncharacterized protein n=2 Tax=Vibrio parahaemolyticus TaxID=670 RepID=A0AA46URE3_VIBPH|nr:MULTISPECIES: hypothetical protein [Vibrio harveyi group]MCS0314099.1 hypothetical protein [Vibrio diabolicus]UYV30477.1 hypothetical protein M5598_26075 [Vibrio parahaemolyticus]UYW19512.1 hypothetical protein IF561_24585 [Vibrio parahaemolyticus]